MNTVLIVEDEKLIRQGIRTMIQRCGVPVETIMECNNGEAALDILQLHHIDVMFTDIRMPKMNGIELVKSMQELPSPPLTVAVSGYDEFSYAIEMLRLGVRDYLLKPIERNRIKQILEKLEAEINQSKINIDNNKTIGCQQLKYLIQNVNMTPEESSVIMSQFEDTFSFHEYVVCCLNNEGGEMFFGEGYIYISNLGEHEVYIIEKDALEIYQGQEWPNRYVGVSSPKTGLDKLREGYEEAVKARKKSFWSEKNLVMYKEGIVVGSVLEEEDGQIQACVQTLGTDKAENALKAIRNKLWHTRRQMNLFIEDEIGSFLVSLLKTYEAVLKTDTAEINQFLKLYQFPNIGDYEQALMKWLEEFVKKLNSQFEDYKNKQKIQQAVIYIQENYTKDLNMAVVSNHISMNYSLFSYVFKQYTGSNFVNYLKDIRMEKAKELLEKTELKVIEISQKIGYENEKHFMKIFKTAYGVSPTEYRKNTQFKKKDTKKK